MTPTTTSPGLPSYDPLQAAFHRTFRDELYQAVDGLKLPRRGHVLDAPCGDGFYSRRLVRRLARAGRLTLVDSSRDYLDLAAEAVADAPPGVETDVRAANVYHLPFPDGTFDFVWCAESLISLEDRPRVLREFARVTRPGGRIAVLEADEYHHVLLPWPVGLEVAIQRAVLRASRRRYGSGSRLAPARHLRATLMDAGWTAVRRRTFAADRHPPFKEWEVEFLTRHLAFVSNLIRGDLPTEHREAFDRLVDPASADGFARRADAEVTCLNTLHLARKPV